MMMTTTAINAINFADVSREPTADCELYARARAPPRYCTPPKLLEQRLVRSSDHLRGPRPKSTSCRKSLPSAFRWTSRRALRGALHRRAAARRSAARARPPRRRRLLAVRRLIACIAVVVIILSACRGSVGLVTATTITFPADGRRRRGRVLRGGRRTYPVPRPPRRAHASMRCMHICPRKFLTGVLCGRRKDCCTSLSTAIPI